MKVKLSVFMFMVLMVTALPVRAMTHTTVFEETQQTDYPEPRGVR